MDEDTLIYKQVSSWDTDDVIRWMTGLHECLEMHIPQFQAHCICGSDLLKMSHQQLEYLKVTPVGHQELLLEAVELLSTLEKGRTHDLTLSLASNLSKKTSQLINALNTSRKKKQSSEDMETSAILTRMETTSGVMMAAKLLLSWLDRNPSSLVDDYNSFRTKMLSSGLDLASILQDDYDSAQMLDTCRAILNCTAVMMHPQNISSMEPIQLLTVKLQPKEDLGLGFSLQRTRQGNLVVNNVILNSPASKSGKLYVGVEIVQINDQNVVGWEISKVMETLKASGHEITLVINAGTSQNHGVLNGDETQDSREEDALESCEQSHDESCDSHSLTNQNHEHIANNSQSSNYSDDRSSSQDTLDDIAESPGSFEGDTDFSGMENLLKNRRIPLDLHRTSSAPLTDREKAVALVTSKDSGSSHVLSDEKTSLEEDRDSESLDAVDGSESGGHEARAKRRTSSDGTPKTGKNLKHQMPQVAYRTQVIGGVVVRIPIKPEEQERTNQKRQRNSRQKHRHKKTGLVEGVSEEYGPGEGEVSEDHLPTDGGDETVDKNKAVFSECQEITIGGQTAKQVTVSSNTEIVGGKKASNPALMVPCFQLKDVEREGFMFKLGGSGFTPKNWRKRWFVLKDKKLYYYKTAFDITALGIVDMVGYTIEPSPESKKKYAFKASRQGARTYYFQTETSDDMTSWMESLRGATEPDDQHDLTAVSGTIEASDDEL